MTPQKMLLLDRATPTRNFGAVTLERTCVEVATPSSSAMPAVLAEAAMLARAHGLDHMVVLGDSPLRGAEGWPIGLRVTRFPMDLRCGEGARCGTVEVAPVREALSRWTELEALEAFLGTEAALVLANFVFERQRDVRPLVSTLKRLLLRAPRSRLVVAIKNCTSPGSAPTDGHYREWSAPAFIEFLGASGFTEVRLMRPERAREHGSSYGTVLLEVGLEAEAYDRFLLQAGLPKRQVRGLVLASEHDGCLDSGDAGRLVKARLDTAPELLALGVVASDSSRPVLSSGRLERWVTPEKLGLATQGRGASGQSRTLDFVGQILSYYTELTEVEYQDYLGLGAELVSARRCGVLPSRISLGVICVGTTPVRERMSGEWGAWNDQRSCLDERLAIEGADQLVFPSVSRRRLYEALGYQVDEARVSYMLPRQQAHEDGPPARHFDTAETVILVGRLEHPAGLSRMARSVGALLEGGTLHRLRRIVVLVPFGAEVEEEVVLLRSKAGPRDVEVEEVSVDRSSMLGVLRREAPCAVAVTSFTDADDPAGLVDLLATGVQLLAQDVETSTRVSEVPWLAHCRIGGEPRILADALTGLLGEDPPVRQAQVERVWSLVSAWMSECGASAGSAASRPTIPASRVFMPEQSTQGTLSVIVPCFNTDLRCVEDLIVGLNEQTLAPHKIVFVDDGSHGDYAPKLQELVRARCRHPFAIIRHAVNRGLPAARNTGLAEVQTDYVVNIDSDDVPKNDFLFRYAYALDHSPELVALTSYVDFFDDGKDYRFKSNTSSEAYCPCGDGVVLGQLENCFGHANSAFRVEALRKVGGWDASDTAMWEDWALFLKLVSLGHRVGVVPLATSLYRCRQQSMARTYAQFPAQLRLGRATQGLSRFEAFRLQGALRALKANVEAADARARAAEGEVEWMRARHVEHAKELQALESRSAHLARELERFRHRIGRDLLSIVERNTQLYEGMRGVRDQSIVTARRLRTWSKRALRMVPSDGAEESRSRGDSDAGGWPVRYALADFANDTLKRMPFVQPPLKGLAAALLGVGTPKNVNG